MSAAPSSREKENPHRVIRELRREATPCRTKPGRQWGEAGSRGRHLFLITRGTRELVFKACGALFGWMDTL